MRLVQQLSSFYTSWPLPYVGSVSFLTRVVEGNKTALIKSTLDYKLEDSIIYIFDFYHAIYFADYFRN